MKNTTLSQTYPLTVLLIIDSLIKMGGAERSLGQLAKGLRDRGHKVIICCLRGGKVSKNLRRKGLFVEELNVTGILNTTSLRALLKMIKIVRHERVSVIMSYHKSSDYMGLLIAMLARIPIVSSRRDMGFELRSKHIWFYRLINRCFSSIATVSDAVKKNIVETQWAKPSKITVVSNGVDQFDKEKSSIWLDSKIQIDDQCVNICCLANIRPIKGQIYLVEAASQVIKKFPSARFFLVGRKKLNKAYYQEVERKIQENGLEKTVICTGSIPPPYVASFLHKMDISVLSSLSEGMSNTVLESMAAALPVVATAVGGNPEVIVDGKTGYLIPAGDPKSLSQALIKLLSETALRRAMGLRGRSRLISLFSLEQMINKYEDLIKYVYLNRKASFWIRYQNWIKRSILSAKCFGKIIISFIFYYSGFISILRTIKKTLRLGKVKILCFHNISEIATRDLNLDISISPASFSNMIKFLVDRYHVVSINEAAKLLETGQALTDDVFAITFDDGYKGWVKYVMPECKRFQIPYTLFLSTDPLDFGIPLFYNTLIFLIENTWRKVADLSSWGMGVFCIDTKPNIINFIQVANDYWKGKRKEDRHKFLEYLSKYFDVELIKDNFRELVLNWEDVREMDRSGATIGAHTTSHSRLSDFPVSNSSCEIIKGKRRLEEELSHSVDLFAYPFGSAKDYSLETTKIVEKAGFRYAFTLNKGTINQFKAFEIGRRNVSPGMFEGLNGNFCEALFANEMCGLADYLFGRVLLKRAFQIFS